jgi:cholesterol transport system auxiliary component
MKPSRPLAAVAAVALSLALGGCISVFPKATPAQLYSFGTTTPAQHGGAAGAPTFNVLRAVTTFVPAAAGDRILTTNGQQVAYIAGNRWVSPASVLFEEAETRAFDGDEGPARLIRRGEIVGATAELRLEVQTFEVRYDGGKAAAPMVVVQVRAVLVNLADRKLIEARTFESRQGVADNRVGLIVRGFDAATTEVLGQIVGWTDGQAAAVAAAKG